jgi:hypothetical protein
MRTRGLLIGILILVVTASAQPKTKAKAYQAGTILSVQKQEASGVSYRKATDAPARSSVFIYDVSVQLNDVVVVGRYQSATDFLPNIWSKGSAVEVSMHGHRMYLKGSSVEDFELNIVSRRRLRKEK